jgi:hypothetical protein
MCVYFFVEIVHLWVFSPFVHGKSITGLRSPAPIRKRGGGKQTPWTPVRRNSVIQGLNLQFQNSKNANFNLQISGLNVEMGMKIW